MPGNSNLHDRHVNSLWYEEDILHTARSTPNTSMSLDAFGNVTNAIDTAGNSWQFAYAHNSTLTNEVFTSPCLRDSVCKTNALSRLIDAYMRPIGYDLAINNTPRSCTRYGYDTEGRIATLAATNAANRGFQVEYHNESGYNCGYMLMTPNGAILTRTVTRDPFRRSLTLDCTTRFNNVEVASFAYTFDAHNRPIARNNDRFAYNDRDEITSDLIGTNIINRAYDTIGNHVFCAFNSATNFYANNQLNQTVAQYSIVSHGGTEPRSGEDAGENESLLFTTNSLTWSAQGGLQRDGRFVYAFDAEDQLTSVTSSHLTNGAIRVVNAYDYRHRRISKTVYRCVVNTVQVPAGSPPSPASTTTWDVKERHDFVYDDWNLIHETVTTVDANSTTNVSEIEYFWGPDLSNTIQGAGGVGGLLAVSRNGQFYFPIYDNLGNIVKYLDESGNIVASYTCDDFGRMLAATGLNASSFAFLFSTKYFDSIVCCYNYGCRFYNCDLKMWLVRDLIAEKGGVNLYGFCMNNPVGDFDLFGLKKWRIWEVVRPSKCKGTDIDKAAKDALRLAVRLTNTDSPRVEYYGNLCCSCKSGKPEVVRTGPLWGHNINGATQKNQVTYASFVDDIRTKCPKGTTLVGYYHSHLFSPNFSGRDLDAQQARDYPFYVSVDGRHFKKAIPRRTDDPSKSGIPLRFKPRGEFPVRPRIIELE